MVTASPTEPLTKILNGEKLIGLAAAAKLLPGHRGGESLDTSTMFRWITRGVLIGGQRHHLEAVRAGTRWLTSAEAVARFIELLTAVSSPSVDCAPLPGTPSQRNRNANDASKQLDELLGGTKTTKSKR